MDEGQGKNPQDEEKAWEVIGTCLYKLSDFFLFFFHKQISGESLSTLMPPLPSTGRSIKIYTNLVRSTRCCGSCEFILRVTLIECCVLTDQGNQTGNFTRLRQNVSAATCVSGSISFTTSSPSCTCYPSDSCSLPFTDVDMATFLHNRKCAVFLNK